MKSSISKFAIGAAVAFFATKGFSAQQTYAECQPIPHPYPADFQQDWNADLSYDLIEGGNKSSRTLVFSGDRLVINQANFGSLLRDVDQPGSGISAITFDAREIVLEGPITLSASKISIRAKNFIITGGGLLALSSPPNKTADGLFIATESLELKNALGYPFLIVPQRGNDTDGARQISVMAKNLVIDGIAIPESDAASTLWRRTQGSIFSTSSPSTDLYLATFGEKGYKAVVSEASRLATWPTHFIKKLSKFHARAPYDNNALAILSKQINENTLAINAIGNLQTISRLREIQSNIRNHVDGFGQSAAFVPRESLTRQIDRLKRGKDDKEYLQFLENLIISGPADPDSRENQLLPLRTEIAAAIADEEALEPQLREALASVSQQESKINLTISKAAARRVEIRQHEEQKARRHQSQLEAAMAVQKVGMVVSMIPHPVAQGVGTGLSVSSAIITNEEGGQVNVVQAVYTFQEIQKANDRFKSKVDSAIKGFDTARIAKDNALRDISSKTNSASDKGESAKKFFAAAQGFSDAMKGVYGELNVESKPTDIQLAKAEANDPELMALLELIGQQRTAQAETINDVARLQTAVNQAMNRVVAQRALEQEVLRFGQIQNDEDLARWRAVALTLWQSHFNDLYRTAIRLRRSFQYETGKSPAVPSDVLFYPDEGIAYIKSGLFNPESTEKIGASKDSLKSSLIDRRDKFLFFASAMVSAATNGYEDYLNQRTSADQINVPAVFDKGQNTRKSNRDFLNLLNSEIKRAIKADRRSTASITMPIDFPSSDSPFPLKYIGSQVTSVKFEDPTSISGYQFFFRILHPGFGYIRSNGVCNVVDTREYGSNSTITRTTEAPPLVQELDKNDRDNIKRDINGKAYYALPPGETTYQLRVDFVPPSVRKQTPQIERLRVVVKVMQ